MTDYLKQAVDLSRKSFEAGEFPAGAVLVTKSGKVYESDPSLPHYHGECIVIDKAIAAEGYPLDGAVMYASMESCMMCSAKMYWANVFKVHYVIPKDRTKTLYAYEDDLPMAGHIQHFHTPLQVLHDPTHLGEALGLFEDWVKKIEAK
jgi:tRNA(Arg) A34 adenosine deaminase TadA